MGRFERDRSEGNEQHATTLELFYDLVFVFAVTQVSHHLLGHLSWAGAGQSAILLVAVWWSWNYTTWVTNELDPESPVVRMVIVGVMLGSLLMAVAIPRAFGDRALLFAGAYVAIQVGRHLFLTYVAAERGTPGRDRASRILVWFYASGALWIAGALADGTARSLLWVLAVLIDLAGPLTTYVLPFRRAVAASTWDVEASHFAERFQLFIIIALGESIVITGATTADLTLDTARWTAFVVAFFGTAALWWLYFNYAAGMAGRRLALAGDERTSMARDAYTYLHAVLVAGIIVAAVGDELVIAHPTETLPTPEVLAVVGGPALYLLAHVLFRLRLAGSLSRKRLAGALACLACGLLGGVVSGLVLALLVLGVLVAVIVAEQVSGARRTRRGEPSPREQLEASMAQAPTGEGAAAPAAGGRTAV